MLRLSTLVRGLCARCTLLVLWLLSACSPDTAMQSMFASRNGISGSSAGNGAAATPNAPVQLLVPSSAAGSAASDDGCRSATIAFVIDGSGSMCESFGNSTRWGELRSALLAKDTGFVYRLQSLASFGLYIYDGSIDFQLALNAPSTGSSSGGGSMCGGGGGRRRDDMNACPQIVEVKPSFGNASAIDRMYPANELGGSTPTDKAMNYVVDQLLELRQSSPDEQFILLATDGQPNDICVGGTGGDGTAQQQGVIAAVDRAAASGITTFVVSLASDAALQMHLDEVARHGNLADPMAHAYTPTSSAELVGTLTSLLSSAVGCLL